MIPENATTTYSVGSTSDSSRSMYLFLEPRVVNLLERFVEKEAAVEREIAEELFAIAPEQNETDEELLEELEIQESEPVYNDLALDALPPGEVTRMFIAMQQDEMSRSIDVPVIVAKGKVDGPVLGITSALHGNELNGITLIAKLFREIDVETLRGTVIGIPVLNPPGFARHQRAFHDGVDLNRCFPGKKNGNCSQVYCSVILEKLVTKFDYHVDLHTASFGRINSLYVRADMNNSITHHMALLQKAQIIVHNTAPDGSLRSAAMSHDIPCITVEIGNPLKIQHDFVEDALKGVASTLDWLDMLPIHTEDRDDPDTEPLDRNTTVCSRSYWIFSQHGGMLTVGPPTCTWVKKGEVIATVRNMFGDIVTKYKAPEDGIVVGKSVNPICSTGDRILHLGVCDDTFGKKVNDGH
mmetsp:Transcript_15839/g.20300  ORF Transcript_15839/g.20300 Transcript_15839/m.20300 type:complete len:411 (-) Transcript_15839:511-1743(-)